MNKICKKKNCNNTVESEDGRTFLQGSELSNLYCGKHVKLILIDKILRKQNYNCPVCIKKLKDDFIIRLINEEEERVISNFVIVHFECKDLLKKILRSKARCF